jgi:Right handed beta helix region
MKLCIFFLILPIASASVATLQLTHDGNPAGLCTGSGVTLYSYSQFNNSSNWGSGSNQIGSDTVILACGTFSGSPNNGFLGFAGSGTSGHPIVFVCDTTNGTSFTNQQWGGGTGAPLLIQGHNYITLDGTGCTIQNTSNGTGLMYNAYSTGIYVNGTGITVKNFTISNICQHTSTSDSTGCVTSGNLSAAIITSGSNILVQNNLIHDTAYGIFHNAGTSDSGVTITGNTITRANQHIAVGTASAGQAVSAISIQGNNLQNAVNWDTTGDSFHHNGIFLFNGSGGVISGVNIYNNFIGGDFGVDDTSYMFVDVNGGTISGVVEFNNLMINGSTSNGPSNGFITSLGSGGAAYNNTIFCNGAGFAGMKLDGSTDTIENNIISDCPHYGIYVNSGAALSASDYNVIYDLGGGADSMFYNGTNYASVAAWTSGTAFDSHSQTGNPIINTSTGVISGGSSAIGTGTNLTSLMISPLDSDYAGNPRPSTGPWDIGAYQYVQATPKGISSATGISAGNSVQ